VYASRAPTRPTTTQITVIAENVIRSLFVSAAHFTQRIAAMEMVNRGLLRAKRSEPPVGRQPATERPGNFPAQGFWAAALALSSSCLRRMSAGQRALMYDSTATISASLSTPSYGGIVDT
jgi:hypothetical protein